MTPQLAIARLVERRDLDEAEMAAVCEGMLAGAATPAVRPAGEWIAGRKCINATCITNHEPGLRARMEQSGQAGLVRCAHCDQEQEAKA